MGAVVTGAAAQEQVVPAAPLRPLERPRESGPALLPELLPPLEERAPAAAPPLPAGVPPLGLPSDGETAPSFPDLPDLPSGAFPGSAPQSPLLDVPAEPSAQEPEPETGVRPPEPETREAVPGTMPPPEAGAVPFAEWHQSPKAARDLAAARNCCFLVVFASGRGPSDESGQAAPSLSQVLNHEVFATEEFNRFALEHLVLCALDYSSKSNLMLPRELARQDALEQFKERLKVRGFPTAILFGPDGKEIRRWSGYYIDQKTRKGNGPSYLQQLQRAVLGHEAVLYQEERRRDELVQKGYREWTSAQGSTLFARLVEYDARTAVLRDQNGEDRKVPLQQLNIADREYITRKRLGRPLPNAAP